MKILRTLLFAVGACFCIVGLIGHDAAFSPAAICLGGASALTFGRKKTPRE